MITQLQARAGMPVTRPLRRALAQSLPERPFTVRFWDGGTLVATRPGGPTIRFADPVALGHVVRRPGPLGFYRGYVSGGLTVDDLGDAWRAMANWEPPSLSPGERVRIMATALLAAALGRVLERRGLA